MTEGSRGWYLADVRCPLGHKIGEVYHDGHADPVLLGHRPSGQGAHPLSGAGPFDGFCAKCQRTYPGDLAAAAASALARRYYVLRRTASM